MGILERGGEVRTIIVPNRKKHALQSEVRKHVEAGSALYTDFLLSYEGLASDYAHQVVDHAVEYVNGRVHTNGLENFWSLLKRSINGTYVSVELFHLFRYLDEQTFRYNNRKNMSDADRFSAASLRFRSPPHLCRSHRQGERNDQLSISAGRSGDVFLCLNPQSKKLAFLACLHLKCEFFQPIVELNGRISNGVVTQPRFVTSRTPLNPCRRGVLRWRKRELSSAVVAVEDEGRNVLYFDQTSTLNRHLLFPAFLVFRSCARSIFSCSIAALTICGGTLRSLSIARWNFSASVFSLRFSGIVFSSYLRSMASKRC